MSMVTKSSLFSSHLLFVSNGYKILSDSYSTALLFFYIFENLSIPSLEAIYIFCKCPY